MPDMRQVYLSSLGGAGENGRNCHLIETADGILLLDCGVMRETGDGQVGRYPTLTKELVKRVRAVFLSHCHEDHTAALPLLYELGYEGAVYASPETIREVPAYIRKWMDYVARNGGKLPYGPESAERLRFVPVTPDTKTLAGIPVELGRSGHVPGGLWCCFQMEGKRILYTGDMCMESGLLRWDSPGACDAALADGAHFGLRLSQEVQYTVLLRAVEDCLEAGGKVLLPVPPKGRGAELVLFLGQRLPCVIVETALADGVRQLAEQTGWLKSGICPNLPDMVRVLDVETALRQTGPAVYLVPDGMLSTPLSLQYYEALKGASANKIILTGHAAKGTVAAGVLDPGWRETHGVKAGAEKILFKVHLDDADLEQLCGLTGAKQVLLFHSGATERLVYPQRIAL